MAFARPGDLWAGKGARSSHGVTNTGVEGPIAITNTHSVGAMRDAAGAWMVQQVSHLLLVDQHCFTDRSIKRHVEWHSYGEEAILNAMVGAETVIGAAGLRVDKLPEGPVRALFK